MPYYLVTHTSLVEGPDEVKAAEKVLAKLRSDGVVQFVVKFDEATVKTVAIAGAGNNQVPSPAATDILPGLSQVNGCPARGLSREEVCSEPQTQSWAGKSLVAGAALFVAGFLLQPIFNLLY